MYRLKILITGVSGFIGRSLVEEIVEQNLPWDIFGIDLKKPVFNNAKYLNHVVFDRVDIRNEDEVKAYFSNNEFDGVIHLAAVSRVVDAENDKEKCKATNFYGSKYVIENVAKNPETWFIFGSSREVYGEQTNFPVKESSEKKPINIYGEYKLKGEQMVQEMIKRYAILRFSNVYGNNYDIDGRVIPAFVNRALQNETLYIEGGGQVIDFTFIDDTVRSIIKTAELLQTKVINTEEIHISPGAENKIMEIVSCLEKLLDKKLRVVLREKRCYDVERFIGDPSHRIEILGESSFITLKEGIEKLLAEKRAIRNNTDNKRIDCDR